MQVNKFITFKQQYPFTHRKEECERILCKFADRIPVICERVPNSKLAIMEKRKYLIPKDLTVGQFMYVIRKQLKCAPEESIFFSVNGTIPSSTTAVSQLYHKYKDEDGFLYFTYSGENTFGGDDDDDDSV